MTEPFDIIDIHCHLLPGLDDGAESMAESLAMCRQLAADGVVTVVATPHMAGPRPSPSADEVRGAVLELRTACRADGIDLEVLPGADVHLTPDLFELLDAGELLTVADAGKYLLLELPMFAVPRIEGLVDDLLAGGVTPILTHPERNPDLCRRPDRLAELVRRGCLVQLTAAALQDGFGTPARQMAWQFLGSGLVHVIASDAHSSVGSRSPRLRDAAGALTDTYGEAHARRLLLDNPLAIISGRPLRGERLAKTGTGLDFA